VLKLPGAFLALTGQKETSCGNLLKKIFLKKKVVKGKAYFVHIEEGKCMNGEESVHVDHRNADAILIAEKEMKS